VDVWSRARACCIRMFSAWHFRGAACTLIQRRPRHGRSACCQVGTPTQAEVERAGTFSKKAHSPNPWTDFHPFCVETASVIDYQSISTSPAFKERDTNRIERRDTVFLLSLTYNASDTTTRLGRRASVELGERLSTHPALRVSTQRMVNSAPLTWLVARLPACRPLGRRPSLKLDATATVTDRYRIERPHDDAWAGRLPCPH